MNSFDGKPEAESAAIAAEGPGMGMTGIFSTAHSLACEKNSTACLKSHIFKLRAALDLKQEVGVVH